MAKIGTFDPTLGILGLTDGKAEIGRTNLPGAARLIPESFPDEQVGALVHGRLTDSALLERFDSYLKLDLRNRELLSPDIFFEALEQAAGAFANEAKGDGPMAVTAGRLREVLADRELCELLRNLVIKV